MLFLLLLLFLLFLLFLLSSLLSPLLLLLMPRGVLASAKPTPTEYPYQYGFAREAF